jgi:hypothetical protein
MKYEMEEKLKHLEFIQNVITRMNQNSFLIKGWAVTLVSALYALAAKDADMKFVIISYIAIATFWCLDALYLSMERQYRGLYNATRSGSVGDFDMNAKPYAIGKNTWHRTFISRSILFFYGLLAGIALIAMFALQ